MKTICIFLADGFEEVEAMTPVDVLRRAGLVIKTVSVKDDHTVIGAHGVPMIADMVIAQLETKDIEMIILPGGMPGSVNLDSNHALDNLIMKFAEEGKPISAICAAPMVLGKRGLLQGKRATCYPGFDKFLNGAEYTANLVEVDGNYITGKGPGAAMKFSFAIVEKYCGKQKVDELKAAMMIE